MKPRLLLVELAPDQAERQFRTLAYPFILGLARSLGWQAWWRALGVRYEPTLRYALSAEELLLLKGCAARLEPSVIVVNENLPEGQLREIKAASKGRARAVYCPIGDSLGELDRFLRRALPEAGKSRRASNWLEAIAPDFSREVLNRAPWAADPLLRIEAGRRCSYRTRAQENEFYRPLKLRGGSLACSFCEPSQGADEVKDAAAFAARQVSAACRQLPETGRERRFELIGHRLWSRLEDFVARLASEGVRSAELSFMPRVDEILAARGAIERCLPVLAEHGLSLRLYGAGVENFSAEENLRLNKGVTAAQVHEAAAFMTETAARRPGVFRPDRLSMILFTPWTTVEDLRVNVEHIARCPLIAAPGALASRLQLFAGRPIARLAERDGLLEKAGRGPFYNAGCITSFDQRELPWRFRDPRVGRLFALGSRLSRGGEEPLEAFRSALS